jgi:1-acyl-sn-glycerol-3-phosphate acyltransferase
MSLRARAARAIARGLLPAALRERVDRAGIDDAGHGYDRLGLSRDGAVAALAATRVLYERWFRVRSSGIEQVPRTGAAILAANHSGTLPLDAAMLWADVLRHGEPPRIARMAVDLFVPRLPFVFTAFARCGAIGGDRRTVSRVLGAGELVGIFPEGVPGIAKPRSERYRLRPFRPGHAELAIRHGAPIVPVAIVGAEEQWPELARIESFHAFGAPYLPVPATPFPLPVRYHVRYGAPIDPRRRWTADAADDPAIARGLAEEVRRAVQALVDGALADRHGVFR